MRKTGLIFFRLTALRVVSALMLVLFSANLAAAALSTQGCGQGECCGNCMPVDITLPQLASAVTADCCHAGQGTACRREPAYPSDRSEPAALIPFSPFDSFLATVVAPKSGVRLGGRALFFRRHPHPIVLIQSVPLFLANGVQLR